MHTFAENAMTKNDLNLFLTRHLKLNICSLFMLKDMSETAKSNQTLAGVLPTVGKALVMDANLHSWLLLAI